MCSSFFVRLIQAVLLIFSSFVLDEASALARDAFPTRPGIWCERESPNALSGLQEQRLVTSLARITGFCGLRFAADGELCLGKDSAGGAASAREILLRVLGSSNAYMIEDCSRSDYINFGQVKREATIVNPDHTRIDIWRVRLDFNDFQHVQAPDNVRASFDEGFILLHELLHGLGCGDASRAQEIGQCEEIVNEARSELGLPLRDQYFVTPVRVTDNIASARIRFRSGHSSAAVRHRVEWQYLYFLLRTESPPSEGIRSAAERRH